MMLLVRYFSICWNQTFSDWYHGKCVGITKKMGKEMEEVGNEWTCPKCENKVEKEATDKQNAQLKDKLKERVATAQQVIPTKKSTISNTKSSVKELSTTEAVTDKNKKQVIYFLGTTILNNRLNDYHGCEINELISLLWSDAVLGQIEINT